MTPQVATNPPLHSIAEYLRLEQSLDTKLDWRGGTIYVMPGARPRHGELTSQLTYMLRHRLGRKGPCTYLDQDHKVTDPGRTFFSYPDGLIACPPEYDPDSTVAVVLNPKVIFEVLSPSTEKHDRTDKFEGYKRIPSFEEYVLVHPDEPRIEVFRAPGWTATILAGLDAMLTLESVGVDLPLATLYSHLPELP